MTPNTLRCSWAFTGGTQLLACALLFTACGGNEQSLEGDLVVVQVEGHGPGSGMKRFLAHDGTRVPLAFERPPKSVSGTRLVVRGHYEDGAFKVTDYAIDGAQIGRAREQLANQSVKRSRSLTFVEVDLGGGIALPQGAAGPDSGI